MSFCKNDVCIMCSKILKKCSKCSSKSISDSDTEDVNGLIDITFDVTDVDLTKCDNMIFNPLKFDCNSIYKCYNDVHNDDIHECTYLTPEKFCSDSTASSGKLNFLNVNIRSLTKNLDNFKECLKALNCDFKHYWCFRNPFKRKTK